MDNLKNINSYTLLFLLFLTMGACNLFDVDDIKPLNVITEDTVVVDEESANKLLMRVYAYYRESRIPNLIYGLASQGVDSHLTGSNMFDNNDVNPIDDDDDLRGFYRFLYKAINHCNFLIENLAAGKAGNPSKKSIKEIMSQARTFRGLSHFYLLRAFGQFYDLDSKYGIVLSEKPYVRAADATKRTTVKQVYASIEADFKYGAANGPVGKESYYINALASKGFLAQVYLYQKKYALAAQTAKEVIDDGTFKLEPNYADIFSGTITALSVSDAKGRWKSKEVMYCTYGEGNKTDTEGNTFIQFGMNMGPSDHIVKVADAQVGTDSDGSGASTVPKYKTGYDPRFTTYYKNYNNIYFQLGKYPFQPHRSADEANTFYYLRLAEMYYIYAEAELMRNGGNPNEALKKLNAIKSRAGLPAKTYTDKATLLKDIIEDKMIEFFGETMGARSDYIRYEKWNYPGAVKMSTINTNLTDTNYILPFPISVMAGNSKLEQNPGY